MKKGNAARRKGDNAHNPRPHAGALIHKLALEKGFTIEKLATLLGVHKSTVYALLKKPYAIIEHAMLLSVAFDEDLVQLLFAPSITPRPNPLQAEVDRLNNIVQQQQQKIENDNHLHDENLKQQGRIEELEKLLREERGRK